MASCVHFLDRRQHGRALSSLQLFGPLRRALLNRDHSSDKMRSTFWPARDAMDDNATAMPGCCNHLVTVVTLIIATAPSRYHQDDV